MISLTLVLSVLAALAATLAAYFLGRQDGSESTRNRYSRMMSNLNTELEDLINNVKAAGSVEEELKFPAEPEGKGSEVTELPKESKFLNLEVPAGVDDTLGVPPSSTKKKSASKKKAEDKPKRKKGKK